MPKIGSLPEARGRAKPSPRAMESQAVMTLFYELPRHDDIWRRAESRLR